MDAQNTGAVPARKPTGRPFKPGQSGNPGGRPKAVQSVVEAAREHTALAISTLAEIVADVTQPAPARVTASGILLDRAWGKATQTIASDGAGITIQIVSGVARAPDEEA